MKIRLSNYIELSRADKAQTIRMAVLKYIALRSHGKILGLPEVNINIGKGKSNLRVDVLEVNRYRNVLVGYEIKSCIEDFRRDKKWHNYLEILNQLYFVFDSGTLNQYKDEIISKIDGRAGICVYDISLKWVSLISGTRYIEHEEKQEEFYRTILFNYLLREAKKTQYEQSN